MTVLIVNVTAIKLMVITLGKSFLSAVVVCTHSSLDAVITSRYSFCMRTTSELSLAFE